MDYQVVISDQFSVLASGLASRYNLPHLTISAPSFISTETDIGYLLNQHIQHKHVLYVHQFFTAAEETVNASLFRLILTLQSLRLAGVKAMTLLIPYFPYSRQDKAIKGVTPYSLILEQFKNLGIEQIITYDMHNPRALESSIIPINNQTSTSCWIEHIQRNEKLEDLCIASPDYGAHLRAYPIAQHFNIPMISLRKHRSSNGTIAITHIVGNVHGKRVIIIDDIFDTGKTALASCQALLHAGAKRITGYFSHGVFSEQGLDALKISDFESIVVGNSILSNRSDLIKKINTIDITQHLTL